MTMFLLVYYYMYTIYIKKTLKIRLGKDRHFFVDISSKNLILKLNNIN